MLKTISAALLAASMIAAPAFAAGTGKTAQTSAVKTEQAPVINGAQAKTDVKTGAKTSAKTSAKNGALNANAKMRHHHHKYHKMGAMKSKKNLATVGFNGAAKAKSSKASFGRVSTHESKIHASKSHSKVSFKHTAPATKRG
jgi:hypothetical protein